MSFLVQKSQTLLSFLPHFPIILSLKSLISKLPLCLIRRQAATTATTGGGILPTPEDKNSHKVLNKATLPYGIRDNKEARQVAEALDPGEKKLVFDALRKIMADQYNEHKRLGQAEVHIDDLLSLWYVYFSSHFVVGVIHSLNLIFLSEYLQHFLGNRAGLTIMTAAGLANVVANVGLLNFALHFEKVLDTVNIRRPVLSAEQLHNPEVGYVQRAAKALGMLFGSLIGLTPLLFYDHPVDTRARKEKKIQRSHHAPYARTFQEDAAFQYADSEEEQIRREEDEVILIKRDSASEEDSLIIATVI